MKNQFPQLLFLLLCTCGPALLLAQLNEDHWKALAPRSIGPAGMSGRITAIDVHPQDKDKIYVGSASGGLWMSENAGTSFQPLFDEQKYLSIGAVAISDANPSIVWAGTGEGNPRNSANYGGGIYKSLDGGKTWEMMGLEDTKAIHRILPHPTDPETVYVAALGNMWAPNEERGVYRTTDGGENWEKILYINDGTGIAEMVMDPSNPDKLIAATWTFDRDPWFFNSGGPGSGIWVTTDGGLNFSHDGGDTWRFAENLPLAQFYHIAHDMSYPYLVGGGMQDNGSWVGPSQGLKSGGITAADWQEVFFGDGFDMIFKPNEPDVVYARSKYRLL